MYLNQVDNVFPVDSPDLGSAFTPLMGVKCLPYSLLLVVLEAVMHEGVTDPSHLIGTGASMRRLVNRTIPAGITFHPMGLDRPASIRTL